jgi:hypothetical protein
MSFTRGLALKLHKFTFNGRIYTVRLPDIYDTIKNDVGIEEVANGERPDNSDDVTLKAALRDGKLIRLRVSYLDGTKRKTSNIICLSSKISSAINGLPDKSINGKQIRSAYQPTRRRLG